MGRPFAEEPLVGRQLGRRPRPPWRVAARCPLGAPTVIASPSRLSDGDPFPTLYWLTCPRLRAEADSRESAGGTDEWASRLAADRPLADRMRAADAEYRRRRSDESSGDDVCAAVGIGGQRDPLATKCLHAHLAAALAGIDDPVGVAILETCPWCEELPPDCAEEKP